MIDHDRLLDLFLDLVRISSPSGEEGEVSAYLQQKLHALGLEVESDEAGNLYAYVDGTGTPLCLTAHMDTVTPCDQVTPVVEDGVIRSDGSSILGADDKSGIAAIIEAVTCALESGEAHRPVDLLFTVAEEAGLVGAKAVEVDRLRARMAIGLDAEGVQGTLVLCAPGQNSLRAVVHGRAAHAGVEPERGINAICVASQAVVAMPLGRIDHETTANIGVISGGRATNIVPDEVVLRSEARSRDADKLTRQTDAMVAALEEAAAAAGATVDVEVRHAYESYRLSEDDALVQLVTAAMGSIGVEPRYVATGGGSDANILNARGMRMVQITTGMREVHTTNENIALEDMAGAARLLLACLTS
ncbi:MAG: M20/M25/M40 family metallo-hydrolase [Anaerolineae bacterium]|jgi:tripeptide aminopeptidase